MLCANTRCTEAMRETTRSWPRPRYSESHVPAPFPEAEVRESACSRHGFLLFCVEASHPVTESYSDGRVTTNSLIKRRPSQCHEGFHAIGSPCSQLGSFLSSQGTRSWEVLLHIWVTQFLMTSHYLNTFCSVLFLNSKTKVNNIDRRKQTSGPDFRCHFTKHTPCVWCKTPITFHFLFSFAEQSVSHGGGNVGFKKSKCKSQSPELHGADDWIRKKQRRNRWCLMLSVNTTILGALQ